MAQGLHGQREGSDGQAWAGPCCSPPHGSSEEAREHELAETRGPGPIRAPRGPRGSRQGLQRDQSRRRQGAAGAGAPRAGAPRTLPLAVVGRPRPHACRGGDAERGEGGWGHGPPRQCRGAGASAGPTRQVQERDQRPHGPPGTCRRGVSPPCPQWRRHRVSVPRHGRCSVAPLGGATQAVGVWGIGVDGEERVVELLQRAQCKRRQWPGSPVRSGDARPPAPWDEHDGRRRWPEQSHRLSGRARAGCVGGCIRGSIAPRTCRRGPRAKPWAWTGAMRPAWTKASGASRLGSRRRRTSPRKRVGVGATIVRRVGTSLRSRPVTNRRCGRRISRSVRVQRRDAGQRSCRIGGMNRACSTGSLPC